MRLLLPDAVRRRLDPAEKYGLRLTLLAAAVVLVAVPFGILLEQVVRQGPLLRFDASVAANLHRGVVGRDWLVALLKGVSWLGRPPLLAALVTAASVFVLWRGRWRLAVFLVTTATLGGLVDTAVKVLVQRPRPVLDEPVASAFGKSFPSGHAMSSTVVYGALLVVFLPVLARPLRRRALVLTAILVTAICISRLALGVHFLSDVLAGVVLGLAWLSASVAAFRIWREDRGRRPRPVLDGVEPEAAPDLALHGR